MKLPAQVQAKIDAAKAAQAELLSAPAGQPEVLDAPVVEPVVATQIETQPLVDAAAVVTSSAGEDALDAPKEQNDGFELAKQYEHKWQTIKGRLKASEKREADALAKVESLTAENATLKSELETTKRAQPASAVSAIPKTKYREALTDDQLDALTPDTLEIIEKLAEQAELRADQRIAAVEAKLEKRVGEVSGTLTKQDQDRQRSVAEAFGKLVTEVEPRIKSFFDNPLWDDFLETEVHGFAVHESMQRLLEKGKAAMSAGDLVAARKAAEGIKALTEGFAKKVATPSAPGALRSAPSSAAGGVPRQSQHTFDEQTYHDSVKGFASGKVSRAQHGEVKKQYEAAKAAGTLKRMQAVAA